MRLALGLVLYSVLTTLDAGSIIHKGSNPRSEIHQEVDMETGYYSPTEQSDSSQVNLIIIHHKQMLGHLATSKTPLVSLVAGEKVSVQQPAGNGLIAEW